MRGKAYSSPADRILARISVHPLGCWEFQGRRTPKGYGRVRVDGRDLRAHRVIYEDWFGPIPDGLTLDHLCFNTSCVNPAHLEPVTARENTLRMIAAGRHYLTGDSSREPRRVCRRGHPLEGPNLIVEPGRQRRCRACRNAADRRRYRRSTSD